jgi:hypothetical protein
VRRAVFVVHGRLEEERLEEERGRGREEDRRRREARGGEVEGHISFEHL